MKNFTNGIKKFISRLLTVFGIIIMIPVLIWGIFWVDYNILRDGAFSPTIEYNKVITTDDKSYKVSEMEEIGGYIVLPVTYTNNYKDKEQTISADLFSEVPSRFQSKYENIAVRNKETGEINKLDKEYPSKDFERAAKEVNFLTITPNVILNAGETRTLYYPLARIIDMSVDTMLDIKEQGFEKNTYEIIYMDERAGEYKLLNVK